MRKPKIRELSTDHADNSRKPFRFIGYSALPWWSWDHFMVISSNYLGDIDFIPWNSYLRFIP